MSGQHPPSERPVVYVLKRFPRLSETFILRELLGLESAGDRVVIYSLLPPEEGIRHPELANLRAPVTVLPRHPKLLDGCVLRAHVRLAIRHPLTWSSIARRARRTGTWKRFLQAGIVARDAIRMDARHLHAHFVTAAAEVARDAGALSGLPVTVTAHAKDIFHADNAPLVRQRLAGAAGVVTVSEYNAEHLRDIVPDLRVQFVGNGMPVQEPLTPKADGPVLCVARLVPKKGIDTLLRACARLAGGSDRFDLVIVGDGPLRGDLETMAKDLGIEDRVHFAGSLDSTGVADAYATCSMVVLPCRVDADGDRDGMPTVLLEAMSRGLPVISTDIVGIPELVDGQSTGLLVPPDDPRALAEAIVRLKNDPQLGVELGSNGRNLIATTFDPQITISRLRGVFENSGLPR